MPPDPEIAAPILATHLSRLCVVAHAVTLGMNIGIDDHFAFMSACFLSKQIEHAHGLLRLAEHPDSELVARSMLEGLWQLQWTSVDPGARAARWRGFAYIHDWRLMIEHESSGRPISAERRSDILRGIATYGARFYSTKAKRALELGQPLPSDPYENTWHGTQIRQMAAQVGDLDLYLTAYEQFSERHHWDPAGVARGIVLSDSGLTYNASSPSTRASSIAIAYLCVFRSALTIDGAFSRGMRDELMPLYDEYVAYSRDHGDSVQ